MLLMNEEEQRLPPRSPDPLVAHRLCEMIVLELLVRSRDSYDSHSRDQRESLRWARIDVDT